MYSATEHSPTSTSQCRSHRSPRSPLVRQKFVNLNMNAAKIVLKRRCRRRHGRSCQDVQDLSALRASTPSRASKPRPPTRSLYEISSQAQAHHRARRRSWATYTKDTAAGREGQRRPGRLESAVMRSSTFAASKAFDQFQKATK
jgi:hypothetical protein